jgi:hypothetical protein
MLQIETLEVKQLKLSEDLNVRSLRSERVLKNEIFEHEPKEKPLSELLRVIRTTS